MYVERKFYVCMNGSVGISITAALMYAALKNSNCHFPIQTSSIRKHISLVLRIKLFIKFVFALLEQILVSIYSQNMHTHFHITVRIYGYTCIVRKISLHCYWNQYKHLHRPQWQRRCRHITRFIIHCFHLYKYRPPSGPNQLAWHLHWITSLLRVRLS